MYKLLGYILVLGSIANAGVWDVTTPLGTDPISQGDDRVRELKVAIQEALRGQATEGDEAVFPGAAPTVTPRFHYRGLKGSTASRPTAANGGLYFNTTTGNLERSNGTTWDIIANNPGYSAVHGSTAGAVTSAAGVVTLTEHTNSFNVSGTEAVTSFTGWSSGTFITKWVSSRLLTHNSTTLALRNGLSRNLTANDISIFEFTATNSVREIAFYGAGDGANTGEVRIHASSTVPAGFLECNGASLLRADYPALWAAIGGAHGVADGTHFNVPSLSGRFIRGWDHSAGNDPDASSRTAFTGGNSGDNVGSVQTSTFSAHTHTYFRGSTTNAMAAGGNGVFTSDAPGTATTPSGGNETRPVNVNMMYVIKY